MTISELRDMFRFDVRDNDSQAYFITDAFYRTLLNEAQVEACVRGNLLSFEELEIIVDADLADYELDANIYAITEADLLVNGTYMSLVVSTARSLRTRRGQSNLSIRGSHPQYLSFVNSSIKLIKTPSESYTLYLNGYRLPDALTGDSSTIEIKPQFHSSLNEWVKYKFYNHPSELVKDDELAVRCLNQFERVFGFKPQAEDSDDEFVDQPKIIKAW